MKFFLRWVLPILMIASTIFGSRLNEYAFNTLEELRQLERIPMSNINALIPGEVLVSGKATPTGKPLLSAWTNKPAVYYLCIHEVERRDSDGDSYWEEERRIEDTVDFWITDASAKIRVDSKRSLGKIDWSVHQSYSHENGNNRYTEYRIEPGQQILTYAMAVESQSELVLTYLTDGQYTPIISTYTEEEERANFGSFAIIYFTIGTAIICLGVLGVAMLFRVHRTLAYLTILTIVCAFHLSQLSYNMMKRDIQNAVSRYDQQLFEAEESINEILDKYRISWQGFNQPLGIEQPHFSVLSDKEIEYIGGIRLGIAQLHHRTRQFLNAFPERLLLPFWDINVESITDPVLSEKERKTLKKAQSAVIRTQLSDFFSYLIAIVGLITCILSTRSGFDHIKTKRLVENLPSNTTKSTTYGLCELKGIIKKDENAEELRSPLTGSICCWFEYKVEERRGSGDKQYYVTIEDYEKHQPFFIEDEEGSIKCYPEDAEFTTSHFETSSKGKLTYYEWSIRENDQAYILATAKPDPKDASKLCLSKEENSDFLITNHTEQEVILSKSWTGLFCLNIAFSGLMCFLLISFATAGGFAATDFLLAAMAAPTYMIGIMMILHYNDLVFLRERVSRNIKNIDISLKKRQDLVKSLNKLTKKYLKHEKSLLTHISKLRSSLDKTMNHPKEIKEFIQTEYQVMQNLRSSLEAYPKLNGHKVTKQLMKKLSHLETEIAFMRSLYNDSASIYNARINSFPDLFFKYLFKFKPASLI